jgi:hypothetical protein
MPSSAYLANKVLDHLLGKTTYTAPATVYLALFTTMPDDSDANGVEVSASGYARVAVTNNTTNFPSASARNKKMAVQFAFPAFAQAGIVGFGLYDASTSGNLLFSERLNNTIDISAAVAARFAANALQFTLR